MRDLSYESYVKLLRALISAVWLSLAALIIVIGLLFSAARLLLPELGKYQSDVAAWVGDVLGQPVKIGALSAGWHGLGPSVKLRDVTVLDAAGKNTVLRCTSARIDIDLWDSLLECVRLPHPHAARRRRRDLRDGIGRCDAVRRNASLEWRFVEAVVAASRAAGNQGQHVRMARPAWSGTVMDFHRRQSAIAQSG